MLLPLDPPLPRGTVLRGEGFLLGQLRSADALATKHYPLPGQGTKGVERASAVGLTCLPAMP